MVKIPEIKRRARLGDDGHWSEDRAGAISYLMFPFPTVTSFRAESLFNSDEFFEQMRAAVKEAGFPEDLGRLYFSDLDDIAAQAVGVRPSFEDENDIEASYAALLSAFAYLDHGLRKNIAKGEVELVHIRSMHIGRLLEWWRWRSLGYDAEAVRGRPFLKNARPGQKRRRAPKRTAAEREAHVLSLAEKILEKGSAKYRRNDGGIIVNKLARRVEEVSVGIETGVKFENAKKIIGRLIAKDQLK